MCLTGVDYFSTLAYQPSIAFVAAGTLSPFATFVLVLLTLLGALPMYNRVAEMSPYGQGSILMLENLFPRWNGKVVVLCLLGFAATSFVITITLSAADAAAHLIENPLAPEWLEHPVLVTTALLLVLGGIFLKGFHEAITMAVVLVAIYLALNAALVVNGLRTIVEHPAVLQSWRASLFAQHGHPIMMTAMALLLFPKLALGLSGFETGVAVMPLVQGDSTDTEAQPAGRIRNTKKLLRTAALIMSVDAARQQLRHRRTHSTSGLCNRRPRGRPRARLSGARAVRTRVRDAVRRQHDRDSVVRRRLSAGRAAQSGSALPAAIRDGAGMGARESPARDHHHGHQHRGDSRVPGGRGGAGRRVCDGRSRAHELSRARGGD